MTTESAEKKYLTQMVISIETDLKQQLESVSAQSGKSQSALVREAISIYLRTMNASPEGQ